jgi:hypothetical protein
MATTGNRRKFQRNSVQIPVAYRRTGGGLCWTRTYDISAGGVKIRSLEPLNTGTPLEISIYIPAPRRDKVFQSQGTVVWCRPAGGGDATLTCGVSFQELLPDLLNYL